MVTEAERDSTARDHELALRHEGCADCKVWVSGKENRTLHVYDPELHQKPNDYEGRPVRWFELGFDEVLYYDMPTEWYLRHAIIVERRGGKYGRG